jgi:hypothetical protein
LVWQTTNQGLVLIVSETGQFSDVNTAAAALILERQVLPGFSVMYSPKGPLLADWTNSSHREQIFLDLELYTKESNAIQLKIDPDLELGRGIKGEEGSIEYPIGLEILEELGQRGWLFSQDQIQFRNSVLVDVMEEIYKEHGRYLNTVLSFGFEGESGMIKMQQIMSGLRAQAPSTIAEMQVLNISDYDAGQTTDIKTGVTTVIDLPKSNVLAYKLPDSNGVIVRPSGTEPKIKVYITACAKEKATAEQLTEKIEHDMKNILHIDS